METTKEIIERICLSKDDTLSWKDISNKVLQETGIALSPDACRKRKAAALSKLNHKLNCDEISQAAKDLNELILDAKKEHVKISDERVQNQAYIRRLAREETIKEIAQITASILAESNKSLIPEYNSIDLLSDKEAILCISDWHYGIETESYWNIYNPEVALERISKLANSVIAYCLSNKVNTIHLVDLGDLIAGRIHLTLRLESRFDVITQVIEISEILSEFISKLSKHFNIKYYSCIDNHSRLEPKKTDSLELETLARIIPWYLRERLKDNARFIYIENTYGKDIITFDVLGNKILGVHGDKDNPINVVDNLSLMTHNHYDLVVTAHKHHFSANEKNTTIVLGNGTLMGTDTYAKNLRLSCNPSQNLVIVSKDNPIEAIYRIKLN